MVRKERLELSHLAALEPKSSASTNSATSAYHALHLSKGAHYSLILRLAASEFQSFQQALPRLSATRLISYPSLSCQCVAKVLFLQGL